LPVNNVQGQLLRTRLRLSKMCKASFYVLRMKKKEYS